MTSPLRLSKTTFLSDQAPSLFADALITDASFELRFVDDAGIDWRSTTQAKRISKTQAHNDILEALLVSIAPDVQDLKAYLQTARSPYGRPHFRNPAAPRSIRLSIKSPAISAEFALTQWPIAPNTLIEDIDEGAIVGRLFVPPEIINPSPIIMVAGSGGGIEQTIAPVLSAHGRPVLSLALFNYPGRPKHHHAIPIDDIAAAAHMLLDRFSENRTSIAGVSRGAEAAILTGIHFPDIIDRVAAIVPSNVVTAGFSPEHGPDVPAWSVNKEPLPYVPAPADAVEIDEACTDIFSFRDAYSLLFRNPKAQADAGLPVGDLHCPLLLAGAGDDQLWPSDVGAELLAAKANTEQTTTKIYPGAGHLLAPTNTPTALSSLVCHPVDKQFLNVGGTPQTQAIANKRFWYDFTQFMGRMD